jgi:hypothetical protein
MFVEVYYRRIEGDGIEWRRKKFNCSKHFLWCAFMGKSTAIILRCSIFFSLRISIRSLIKRFKALSSTVFRRRIGHFHTAISVEMKLRHVYEMNKDDKFPFFSVWLSPFCPQLFVFFTRIPLCVWVGGCRDAVVILNLFLIKNF